MTVATGGGRRAWHWAATLAAAAVILSALLAFGTNLISMTVPPRWLEAHRPWVVLATVLLVFLVAILAVVATRASRRVGDAGEADRQAVSVSPGARVAGPVRGGSGAATVVGQGGGLTTGSIATLVLPAPLPTASPQSQLVVGALPGEPPVFRARTEVDDVARAVVGGRTVVVCTGGPGSGKSQVAAAYARRRVREGCPFVAWVSGESDDALISGLAAAAERLGVADPEGDSRASSRRLRGALNGRAEAGLLVVDNAADHVGLASLLPTAGGCTVVITSTHRGFAELGVEVPVGNFRREESLAYLSERTGQVDDTDAQSVADELGDLPLALAQAAGVIGAQHLSYAAYLEKLRRLPLPRVLPGSTVGYPKGTAEAILLSVESAEATDPSGTTSAVLETLAILDSTGTDRDFLAHLIAQPSMALSIGDADVDEVLGRLASASLATWTRAGDAVSMHRLVARALRDRSRARGGIGKRLAQTAVAIDGLLVVEERAWAERDQAVATIAHALAVWEHAADSAQAGALDLEPFASSARLANRAVRHFVATADLSRAIEVGAAVRAIVERVLGADHPETLSSRNNLAGAYRSAGRLGDATPRYEQNLRDTERVLGAEHPETFASRNNLAHAYESAGQLVDAIPLFEQNLRDAERVLGADHELTRAARVRLAEARPHR